MGIIHWPPALVLGVPCHAYSPAPLQYFLPERVIRRSPDPLRAARCALTDAQAFIGHDNHLSFQHRQAQPRVHLQERILGAFTVQHPGNFTGGSFPQKHLIHQAARITIHQPVITPVIPAAHVPTALATVIEQEYLP